MQINAVILDFGYVLTLPPREEDFEVLRELRGADPVAFREAFWRRRDTYDRGLIDGPAYWGRVASDCHTSFTPEQIAQLIERDIQLWIRPHPVLLPWARLLIQRGIKLAVLSNMPGELGQYIRQTTDWLRPFHHLCFSGELKVWKPEPAIYRTCLEALDVPAGKALFLDDREVNVEGARAVGMHAVVFHSVEKLRADLEAFGLAATLSDAAAHAEQCASDLANALGQRPPPRRSE